MENNFSSNLKHLRIQSGMTQEELGNKLSKDYSTIGKWENGTRSPIMEDVIKISSFFNISLETLIGENIIYEHKNTTEEEDYESLKRVLREKGILDKNDNMSKADSDRLFAFIDANKQFLIKDKNEKNSS